MIWFPGSAWAPMSSGLCPDKTEARRTTETSHERGDCCSRMTRAEAEPPGNAFPAEPGTRIGRNNKLFFVVGFEHCKERGLGD